MTENANLFSRADTPYYAKASSGKPIRPHAGTASFVVVSTPRCASVVKPFLRVLPASFPSKID